MVKFVVVLCLLAYTFIPYRSSTSQTRPSIRSIPLALDIEEGCQQVGSFIIEPKNWQFS